MTRRSFRVIRCDVAGYLYMVLWEVVDTFRSCQYIRDIFSSFLMCDVISWIHSCGFDILSWDPRYCACTVIFFLVSRRHLVFLQDCVPESSRVSIAECSNAT
jgi:hypothetical protein